MLLEGEVVMEGRYQRGMDRKRIQEGQITHRMEEGDVKGIYHRESQIE
jgi:hypothetical protein